MADAIRLRDGIAFWHYTMAQGRTNAYPFLHAWLSLPAWLIAPQITTLRLMSLFYLVASIAVTFWLAQDVYHRSRYRWLAGLAGASFTMLAFPLWVYGSVGYLEAAGLLLTLSTLWCYIRTDPEAEDPLATRRFLLATSGAVAATFLTKYNFGLFLAAAIALNELVGGLLSRRFAGQRLLYLAGPALLIVLIWFADGDKLRHFLAYSQAQQGELYFWRKESWLYYANSLYTHYLNGLPSLLLMIGGLLYGFYSWQQHGQRAVLAYFLMSMALLLIVPQKAPRFLYTVAPAVYLLAGAAVARIVEWIVDRHQRWRYMLLAMLLALFLGQITIAYQRFSFYRPALEIVYDSAPATAEAYRFILAAVPDNESRLLILNSWHLFSSPALLWTGYTTAGGTIGPDFQRRVTTLLAPEPTAANLEQLVNRLRQQNIEIIVTIDGSPAGDYSGWMVMEPLLARGMIELLATSPVYTLNRWADSYREQLLAGAFASESDLQEARRQMRGDFNIQLHLYRVRQESPWPEDR